jgi:UDP:flavonoid glycosyltransferase YjiC (YdhE family)
MVGSPAFIAAPHTHPTTTMTTAAAAAESRGRRRAGGRHPLLLLALAALLLPAVAATTTTATATTKLRATLYSNTDATFERDAGVLPPIFPTSPADTRPIVVPAFVSRSHSTPYIEVVRHLAARGYRVILLTDVRNARWIRSLYGPDGGPFEIAVAPEETTEPSWHRLAATLESTIESANGARALAKFIAKFGVAQTQETFPWVRDYLEQLKPSLVVADLMQEWLVDAAELSGARLVMTTSGLFPGMADAAWSVPLTSNYPAATLEKAHFVARFKTLVVEPLDTLSAMLPVSKQLNAARAKVGLPPIHGPPNDRVKGRLHLVNSIVGHEVARPLPPYVRMIGPVRSDGNTTLVGEWKAFVDGLGANGRDKSKSNPPRLIYLGFGQNAILTPPRLRGVLAALKELLAEDAVDGAVWSLSMTPPEYLDQAGFNAPNAVPPQIKLTDFAPQKALLASPATKVFVSHGGAESVGEGIYSATPMMMAPHFGDQASNAYRLEATGMALVVPKEGLADAERVAQTLRRLLSEPEFGLEARRMRGLALSQARLSAEKAADEVEYILHHGDDYLRDPSERMGFVRRNNLDVYGAALVVVAAPLVAVVALLRAVLRVGGRSDCPGGVCKLPPAKKVD